MKLLIQWAFTSSALIVILLAVRFFCRDKLSARLRYALWGIVLVRLLVPVQIQLPGPVSQAMPVLASNLAAEAAPRLEDRMLYAIPTEQRPQEGLGEETGFSRTFHSDANTGWEYYSGGVVFDGTGITRYLFMMPASELLTGLWKWGVVLCLTAVFYSNWCFSVRLASRRRRLEETGSPIPVYLAEGLASPCLFGVFRPAVYVTPAAAEHPDTLRHVLAHELTHYAHRDHIWALLRCGALALHWYNPLVWLAVGLSRRDGELACDEGAVVRLGEGERLPYGRTLVDMVAARSLRPADLLSCSTAMSGGKTSVQQRIAQLVKQPRTVKTAVFGAAAVLVLAAVFVFTGRGEPERGLYSHYRYQVGRTRAVWYSPTLYSSHFYANPVIDGDLLPQALEILDSAADLLNTPEELGLDLSEAPFTSPCVTLLENPDDTTGGHTYLLYTAPMGNREQCFLVTPAEPGAESYGVAGVLDASAPARLENLARQQSSTQPPASTAANRYHAQLEAAQGIWLSAPMLHAGNVLTDPELLDQVRELLLLDWVSLGTATLSGAGEEETPEWDGTWTHVLSFSVTRPDPDWTGGPDYYYLEATGQGGYRLWFDGTDGAGTCLGGISGEHWEKAEAILQNAPTADDRQQAAREQALEEQNARLNGNLRGCDSIWFKDDPDRPLTDPALLEEAKQILTSGLLVDDGAGAGEEDDYETVVIRSRGGTGLAEWKTTSYTIRGRLYELMQIQHDPDSTLPPAQVLQARKAFQELVRREDGVIDFTGISCFFTSSYDSPARINLEEFLRYCPLAEVLEEEDAAEFQAVMEQDDSWGQDGTWNVPSDLMVPVKRYPREKVSALLQQYTGVTVEELEWPESLIYVEEYDAFYNFTSDFGPGVFHCTGGQDLGSTVRLWSERLENGDRSELVLEKQDGRYLIQSFHCAYPR